MKLDDTSTSPSASELVWSAQQQAAIADIAYGCGHTVILARAGTGKTSVLVEGIHYLSPSTRVLACAFNKRIQRELQARLSGLRHVHVKTLHGVGFAAIRRAFDFVDVDNEKGQRLAQAAAADIGDEDAWRRVAQLASWGKNILARAEAELIEPAITLGLDSEDLPAHMIARAAWSAMRAAREDHASIDYDDMLWLPWACGLSLAQYDTVLIDELQDVNAAQLWLVFQSVRASGRIIGVGDSRQALYAFRGASTATVEQTIAALSARVLPLTISYRCPRATIEVVKPIVPDIEAAPAAPDGIYKRLSEAHLDPGEGLWPSPEPGDFILSRLNAPLMRVCLNLLRAGVPATVAGRDVGHGLEALVRRSKCRFVDDLSDWLNTFYTRERSRLLGLRQIPALSALEDRVDAVRAVAYGLETVNDVIERINRMFSDIDGDRDDRSRVVCSTVHKVKGLERPRVFALGATFWHVSKHEEGVTAERVREEQNIYYVCVTRAQREFYWCEASKDRY